MATNSKTQSGDARIPAVKQPILLEHYHRLMENKRKAELVLQRCVADLLALEMVLHKPIVLNDWPGHTQARLRRHLAEIEGIGRVPSHD